MVHCVDVYTNVKYKSVAYTYPKIPLSSELVFEILNNFVVVVVFFIVKHFTMTYGTYGKTHEIIVNGYWPRHASIRPKLSKHETIQV